MPFSRRCAQEADGWLRQLGLAWKQLGLIQEAWAWAVADGLGQVGLLGAGSTLRCWMGAASQAPNV